MKDFSTEFDQLIPRLRRYARALAGEPAAADDLVQKTAERAWSRLHLWRHGSDLRVWLFTIMHAIYVKQVRGRSPVHLVPADGKVFEMTTHTPQSDPPGIHDLEAALRRLPDDQREVLLLTVLEGLSYEDTARVLGTPADTVMSQLSRAREQLRLFCAGQNS